MWSYRLYRYPSPSSSSLVYGTGKADDNMLREHDSAASVAAAVYRALESGTKMPALGDSPELRAALLGFKPQTRHPAAPRHSDVVNGNSGRRESQDQGEGQDRRSGSPERSQSLGEGQESGSRSRGENNRGKGGTSRDEEGEEEGGACPVRKVPALMLEALSKRRMDAVRTLYEACPQLLTSVPLFDQPRHRPHDASSFSTTTTSPSCPQFPRRVRSHPYSQMSSDSPDTSPTSTTVLFRSHHCPLGRTSRLLDLAAENRALLVFVLTYHPDVHCQQLREKFHRDDRQPQLGKNRQRSEPHTRSGKTPEHTPGRSHQEGSALSHDTVDAERLKEERKETLLPAFQEKDDGGEDDDASSVVELDATSPITICIRQNNVEVLQYLLFKHVWQHFLLDEVFKQPQNSHVPDMEQDDLSHACSECSWFLHCAALVGCSHLLDLVLCGRFCQLGLEPAQESPDPLVADSPYGPDSAGKNRAVKIKNRIDCVREKSVTKSTNSDPKSVNIESDGKKAYVGSSPHTVSRSSTGSPEQNILPSSTGMPHSTTPGDGKLNASGNIEDGDNRQEASTSHTTEDTVLEGGTVHQQQVVEPQAIACDTDVLDVLAPERVGSPLCTQRPVSGSQPLKPSKPPAPSDLHGAEDSAKCDRSSDVRKSAQTSDPGGSHPAVRVTPPTLTPPPPPTLTPCIPDVNQRVAVSLPVMDRWISRCMHVKLSPLHLACWRCDPASIQVLLRHGADVRLMAEELDSPQVDQGQGNTLDGSDSLSRDPSTPSSESSLEMALNFVSVTLNSSSFDLSASYSSMEDLLKHKGGRGGGGGGGGGGGERSGLSPLAMLALGIRSPPDFSLSIGKSLGLVLPTLPELWGGQVDRGCPQARQCLSRALRLLLEAGCDVNRASAVFGKTYRVMELFLQPSVDLYYAPLMPRGGRDSAVLRCMDLERVAELVLSTCWELCSRGARLGPSFASCMEWNLFRMDWMFLQNESLQRRFLHLAVFLGLFPPLEPALLARGSLAAWRAAQEGEEEEIEGGGPFSHHGVAPSSGSVDLTRPFLPPYTPPPRPSCVPWAPTTSRTSTPSQSEDADADDLPSSSGATPTSTPTPTPPPPPVSVSDILLPPGAPGLASDVVTSYYTSAATQAELSDEGNPSPSSLPSSDISSRVVSLLSFSADSAGGGGGGEQAVDGVGQSVGGGQSVREGQSVGERQSGTSTSQEVEGFGAWSVALTSSAISLAFSPATRSPGVAVPGGATRAQLTLWALEERQRRGLEKWVSDVVRLSVPQSCLVLLLRFMCLPDLRLLLAITQHMVAASTTASTSESTLSRLSDALQQAQFRSLRHSCKLVILLAARWRLTAVHCLPLPEGLKRYLVDPQC